MTSWRARSTKKSRPAAAPSTAAPISTCGISARTKSRKSCRRCTSSFSSSPTSTSRRTPWRSRRRFTTPWAGCASRPRPEPRRLSGCTRPARRRPDYTGPIDWVEIRSPTCWSSAGAPGPRPVLMRATSARARSTSVRSTRSKRSSCWRSAPAEPKIPTCCSSSFSRRCRMAPAWHAKKNHSRPVSIKSWSCGSVRPGSTCPDRANTIPAGTRPGIFASC